MAQENTKDGIDLSLAGFRFTFEGQNLCDFILAMPFFRPFRLDLSQGNILGSPDKTQFTVREDISAEEAQTLRKEFEGKEAFFDVSFEDIVCKFFREENRILFRMNEEHSGLELWEEWEIGADTLRTSVVRATATMYRYALWTAVNFLLLSHKCLAIHCSVNVFDSREAVAFLGESGTGKSTHTRLLRERYPQEAHLLNDDSPLVRVMDDGEVLIYGSPWSGKTPCYKAEVYPLRAFVRLSQAPYNKIRPLGPLQGIGALLPSAPPALNYQEETSDQLCEYISDVLEKVSVWALECLPNTEAAELSHDTVLLRRS